MSEPAAPVVLLQGSPHAGGVSDCLADAFAAQFPADAVQRIVLREQHIAPCRGCNACVAPPHRCVLAGEDDANEDIFAAMQQARLLVIAAPIYFYALPGQCKGFIDRGQRLWQARVSQMSHMKDAGEHNEDMGPKTPKSAIALLAAGRPRGEQLFAGALLTLKYFFALFDATLAEQRCFHGLDDVAALRARPEVTDDLGALGRHWARQLGRHLGQERCS